MLDDETVAKAIGALAGSAIALAYAPPRSKAGFMRRLVVSIPIGFFFANILNEALAHTFVYWKADFKHWLASALIMSGVSWPLVGVAWRIIQSYGRKREEDG